MAGLILNPILRRAYPWISPRPPGLERSYCSALGLRAFGRSAGVPAGRIPNLQIYQDPTPGVMVFKDFIGSGTILISQGLFCQLSEENLEEVLELSAMRLNARGARIETFCWLAALVLIRFVPGPWLGWWIGKRRMPSKLERKASPFSAILFWMIYPVLNFLSKMARGRVVPYGEKGDKFAFSRRAIVAFQLAGAFSGSAAKPELENLLRQM